MTLTIITPSLSVDLDDPDVLAIARNGYKQQLPDQKSRIWFEDVDEKVKLNWILADGNESRAAKFADINTVTELVARAQNPTDPVYNNFAYHPYLVNQAPGEGAPRYARLSRLVVPELSSQVYGRSDITDLELVWQREALWRLTAPGAAATSITPSTTSLANHDYSTQHWFDISGPLKGDAPSPLDLLLTYGTYPYGKILVAVLPASEVGFPAGDMFYFAVDATVGAGSLVASTGEAVPGGQMWSWTTSTDGENALAWWSLSDELDLVGRYRVYALSRATAAGDFTYKSYHSQGGGNLYGESVDSPGSAFSGTSWSVTHLGNVNIPAYGYNARVASSGYKVGIQATRNGSTSSTLQLAGIFFVPVNGLVYTATALSTEPKVWIDGDALRTWVTTSGGVIDKRVVPVEGEYPHLLNPQLDHRVYVYTFADDNYLFGKTITATVGYWPKAFTLAKAVWAA